MNLKNKIDTINKLIETKEKEIDKSRDKIANIAKENIELRKELKLAYELESLWLKIYKLQEKLNNAIKEEDANLVRETATELYSKSLEIQNFNKRNAILDLT